MEVIAAVLVGALLWLVGPGRRLWATAAAGNAGARRSRPPPSAAGLRVSRPPPLPASHSAPAPGESGAVALILPTPAVVPASIAPEAPAGQLQRRPITLGVALVLQAVGVAVTALVFAIGYFTLELKLRAEAQALESRLSRQAAALEATQTSTRQTLEALQATAAAQVRALEQLEARLEMLVSKPAKPRTHKD